MASSLTCKKCETEIKGEFELSIFDYLSKEQQQFVMVFIKNAGSIKAIEKELNISYPTVKKYLQDVQLAMGFTVEEPKELSREDVKRMLRDGEINFDEADELLKKM